MCTLVREGTGIEGVGNSVSTRNIKVDSGLPKFELNSLKIAG